MTEIKKYLLQKVGNFLIMVVYCLGGLSFLFPNSSDVVKPFGAVSLGILLLVTGIFGFPYVRIFDMPEEDGGGA